jgi:hypothetical protein
MWLHRTGMVGVLGGLLLSFSSLGHLSCPTEGRVLAQALPPAPVLAQASRNKWLQFQIVSGRITLSSTRFGNISTSSSSSGRSEKLTIRFNNAQHSASYERSTSQEQLFVEVTSGTRISIRRSGKDDTAIVPVQFTQVPGEPTSLALGPEGQKKVYRAATLWHLLITQPDQCRQHLIPLLELLRADWKLAETAAAMEKALLRAASVGQLPDRRRWDLLVEQLADERFSRREAADRELRSAGKVALSYLRGLDFDRLDAEQQFRVRRIIRSLSLQTGDDTPEQFVWQLVGDGEIWLALLSRPQESTRRLAARQLGAILGRPIRFDPAADPATQKDQIEQLRARIRGKRTGARD